MDFLQILHENIRIRHVQFARQQISGHANNAWASAHLIQFQSVYLRVLQKRKCVVVDGKKWEMLSDREKEGCKTILNKLPQKDLLTLTDTVTNRVVTPENTQGKVIHCLKTEEWTATACTNNLYKLWQYFCTTVIIIWCKCFFLFIGREPTMWPANNCLQIMVCSCVQLFLAANTILLMRKWNHAFLLLAITLAWKWQIASLPEDTS